MEHSNAVRRNASPWRALIGGTLLIDGLTFLAFGMLHAGVHILGIQEPSILAAAIVESVCCVLTIGAGIAVLTRRTWAWRATVVAQAVAAAGVLLGIVSQSLGHGGTSLNFVYHRAILSVLLIGLIVVCVPAVRRSL